MRTEFEAWVKKQDINIAYYGNIDGSAGEYCHPYTQYLWETWQESRKTMEANHAEPSSS